MFSKDDLFTGKLKREKCPLHISKNVIIKSTWGSWGGCDGNGLGTLRSSSGIPWHLLRTQVSHPLSDAFPLHEVFWTFRSPVRWIAAVFPGDYPPVSTFETLSVSLLSFYPLRLPGPWRLNCQAHFPITLEKTPKSSRRNYFLTTESSYSSFFFCYQLPILFQLPNVMEFNFCSRAKVLFYIITCIRGSQLIEARMLSSPAHRALANIGISLKKCKTNKKKKATNINILVSEDAPIADTAGCIWLIK